jgi:hypothetical protein
MKVERIPQAPAFVPVVLTLETKEEADYIFNMLNLSTNTVREVYEQKGLVIPIDLDAILMKYFRKFSEVYRP